MKPIGGYFELELNDYGAFPQSDGLLVNSGRNALEIILRALPANAEVFVPRYTCSVVYTPFERTNTHFIQYDVNDELELPEFPDLKENQYLLYTNYFGIKDEYVNVLSSRYRNHLLIDNCQALFDEPFNDSVAFYSPRKFVGVPDGGVIVSGDYVLPNQKDESYERMTHLLKRIDLGAEAGYSDFRLVSQVIADQPPMHMSDLTKRILRSIDWNSICHKRRNNFEHLHKALSDINEFHIPDMNTFECPMVYPFRTSDHTLRQRLIENKIFVACYWPNVLSDNSESSQAHQLATEIIPLPVDQRYGQKEMDFIASIIR